MKFDIKINGLTDEEEQIAMTNKLFQDLRRADICDVEKSKKEPESTDSADRGMGLLTDVLMFTAQVVAAVGIEELIKFSISWAKKKKTTINVGGVDITGHEDDVVAIVRKLQSTDNNE